jgi:acetoacetate decarboxylase
VEIADILKLPSMPLASPSYPFGPYRFINREYFIVTYESDPDAIRAALPEPLMPDGSNTVLYEFIRMPDSSGFGDYTETGIVIPCLFNGEHVNFTAQMYLDCEPPISAGREIWGFPKKFANPKLHVAHDTLTGRIEYAGQPVAIATMGYKHENLICDPETGTCDPASLTARQKSSSNARALSRSPFSSPCASTTAFTAPALVALTPSMPSRPSSSNASSAPQANAPCEPPP